MKSKPENENAPGCRSPEALNEKSQNANKGTIVNDSTVVPANSQPVFNFGDNQVRLVVRDGEPWFVATDVCVALGYSNTSKAVGDHLDEDERAITLVQRTPNDSLGVQTNIINESGLYALVLRSRKPEARKFAKWVTREVLPSIRKTGSYERAAFTVNPGDKLTAEEAETLRLMLKTAVERLPMEKQGGAMMQGWSKLKAHFKVGYREIPRHEFSEAVSIIARHTAEWEVVDDLPAAKPSLDDTVRMDWAFTLAAQAAAKVQRAVFSCVMNGGEDWKRGRYLLSFDRDRTDDELMAKARQIESNANIVPIDRFHAVIDDSIGVDAQTLTQLASTCMTKLGRMAQSNTKALAV